MKPPLKSAPVFLSVLKDNNEKSHYVSKQYFIALMEKSI